MSVHPPGAHDLHVFVTYAVKAIQFLLRIFSLDKRSLALWRILAGLSTLYDLAIRAPDVHNHYTDMGVLSRMVVLEKFQNMNWITFHLMVGTDFYVGVLFVIHALIAVLMTIGYRTRLMTLLNWLFVCSLQNRNYLLCHSGDTVQRVLLFWSMFLPLGEVFSIDSAFSQNKKQKPRDYSRENMEVLGFPAIAFTVQILVMYVTAHFHKSAPEWRETGIATWLALQLDFFRSPIGSLFSLSPAFCRFLTFSVLFWQKWGTIFYVTPIFNNYFRAFAVLGYVAMHAGFGMCLYLELFTWITIAGVFGLTPGWVWDEAVKYFSDPKKPGIQIFYLKHCSMCSSIATAVNILMLPKTKLIPTHSLPPSHTAPFLGIAVIDSDKVLHTGVDAWLAMSKATPLLFPYRYVFNRKIVHRALYGLSRMLHFHKIADPEAPQKADIQAPFGQEQFPNMAESQSQPENDYITNPKLFFEEEALHWYILKTSFPIVMNVMSNLITGFMLYLIVTWNMGNIHFYQYSTPIPLRGVLYLTQMDQYWGMFAPRPPDVGWWYNMEMELHDGRKAEGVYDGAMVSFQPNFPHTFDKPQSVHNSIVNHRWFKLFENGINTHEHRETLRLNFGRWYCREFNSRHFGDDRVYKFNLYWMSERVDSHKQDGTRYPQAKQTLWSHICYDK